MGSQPSWVPAFFAVMEVVKNLFSEICNIWHFVKDETISYLEAYDPLPLSIQELNNLKCDCIQKGSFFDLVVYPPLGPT